MPFRDPVDVLILGFIGEFPPSADVPYIDIGDIEHGRLFIYYDSSSFNIISDWYIGSENVELELGPDTDETLPAKIFVSNSTAFGGPALTFQTGEFDNRDHATLQLIGAAGEDSDPAPESDTDTPRALISARKLLIRPPQGSDYYLGYRLDQDVDTANSGNVTTTETAVMTITESLNLGATYKLSVRMAVDTSTAGDDVSVKIREDNASGTILNQMPYDIPSASIPINVQLEAEYTATADGAKTFVVTLLRLAGAGNIIKQASATQPAYFYLDYVRG